LTQEFNISGIPHYVLINKMGIIVDKDAEQPEIGGELNLTLVTQIEELLKY